MITNTLARLNTTLCTEFGMFSAGLEVRIIGRTRELYTVVLIEDPRHTLTVPRADLWFGRVKREGKCTDCRRPTLAHLRNGKCTVCALAVDLAAS